MKIFRPCVFFTPEKFRAIFSGKIFFAYSHSTVAGGLLVQS